MGGAGEGAVSSAVLHVFLLLLFGLEEVAGGGHGLLLLLLHAHPLALTLAFAAGWLDLMSVLSGVGGDARVGVEDGQVGVPADVVVLPASTAPFLGLSLWGGLSWRRRGRRGGGRYRRLLDQ